MDKYVKVSVAKEFASTFFGDPILKIAVNAVLDNAPPAEVSLLSRTEQLAIFRLGQMDMQQSAVDMLTAEADSIFGVVRTTLLDAAERVRQMEVPK